MNESTKFRHIDPKGINPRADPCNSVFTYTIENLRRLDLDDDERRLQNVLRLQQGDHGFLQRYISAAQG